MKRCKRCQEELPLDQFYHNQRAGDGLMIYCKDCSRIMSRNSQRKAAQKRREAKEKDGLAPVLCQGARFIRVKCPKCGTKLEVSDDE